MACVVSAGWVALFSVSNLHWFLPAGLRLGTLWLLPRTSWWKMALVEWLAILMVSLARGAHQTLPALVASTVLPWCIYALMVWGIGRHDGNRPSRDALPRLLGTGLAATLFTTVALTAIDFDDDGALPASLPAILVSYSGTTACRDQQLQLPAPHSCDRGPSTCSPTPSRAMAPARHP